MGCDNPEELEAPTSFDDFDDLALSISQSGAVDSNVVQGVFSSVPSGTSFPLVSLPAVLPFTGNSNETNNFEMSTLKNLHTFHQQQLEPNFVNVKSIAPCFASPSEMPRSRGNVAELYHSNMNNMGSSGSFLNESVLSGGIQNPVVSTNFMPARNIVGGFYPAVEKAAKATGINQNSLQTSGSPFDLRYSMQNTRSVGGIGIGNDVNVNPVPYPSPGNIDGSFLTLGLGSNVEDRSRFRFSSKEVSSKLEEALLPPINSSLVQEVNRNFSSLVHGAPSSIPNFGRGVSGLPASASNLGVPAVSSNCDEFGLAPGSRISPTPFTYFSSLPDMRLNSSNSINSGAVGKANVRLSQTVPFKSTQGDSPSPSMPFNNNLTLNPHLGYGKVMEVSEAAQSIWATDHSTVKQQRNRSTSISRNQSFMEAPILNHGSGTVGQDNFGLQSFVDVLHPWANNIFPERLGSQVAGRSGIQPTPGNQFPKRLGLPFSDTAISQAAREGVSTQMGGIQQNKKGNSYQSRDHGPAMHPTELLQPYMAMGPPHVGSPAQFNVGGLPFQAGHSIPISKVEVIPQAQASYIPGHTSLKRRASEVPPIAPTSQRRRTLAQNSHQQMALQRLKVNALDPTSSPSIPFARVKWQGFEESDQPIGEKCLLCKRDVAFTPEGPVSRPPVPPPVAILSCGHVFHDHCLQIITPQDQSKNPPCIPCALGET